LKIQNIQYINDSKTTNVNATFFALDSGIPTVWIVGGVDKVITTIDVIGS
jgi:UDP-N-acetylmuramoylalanine--D-glutamate ligase